MPAPCRVPQRRRKTLVKRKQREIVSSQNSIRGQRSFWKNRQPWALKEQFWRLPWMDGKLEESLQRVYILSRTPTILDTAASKLELRKIQVAMPNLSKYMIHKARSWREKNGVRTAPDSLQRSCLSPQGGCRPPRNTTQKMSTSTTESKKERRCVRFCWWWKAVHAQNIWLTQYERILCVQGD